MASHHLNVNFRLQRMLQATTTSGGPTAHTQPAQMSYQQPPPMHPPQSVIPPSMTVPPPTAPNLYQQAPTLIPPQHTYYRPPPPPQPASQTQTPTAIPELNIDPSQRVGPNSVSFDRLSLMTPTANVNASAESDTGTNQWFAPNRKRCHTGSCMFFFFLISSC